jgi:S1-C subfamily serine protease
MKQKVVYQLTARQILIFGFASALIAVGTIACFNGLNTFGKDSAVAFADDSAVVQPTGISDPSVVSDEQNNIEIYKSLSPGVAFINTTSYTQDFWGDVQEGKGNGSGSVIDANGHILTNAHVIEGASKLTVSFGGEKNFPAKVVGIDPSTDLAVLEITPPKEGLTIVPFGDSEKLVVGQKVLAIGNPFGLDRTLTTGVISGLQRPIRARNGRPIEGAIQTDASINPGNSGGPLLDKFGRIIGINSQILSPAGGSVGVGFAIPVSIAKRVIPQLIQFGEVRRPTLGVGIQDISQLASRGYQFPIEEGLLAIPPDNSTDTTFRKPNVDQLGRVSGDIITAIEGEKITSQDDLFRYLDKKQIGDTVKVEISRDGKTMTIPVKLVSTSSQMPQQRTAPRRF